MDVEGKGEWARGGGKGKSGEGRKGGREGGREGWDWREGRGVIGVQPDMWYQRNFSQKLANGTIRPSKNEGLEDCICFKLGVVSNAFLRKTKVWCWGLQGRGGVWEGGEETERTCCILELSASL